MPTVVAIIAALFFTVFDFSDKRSDQHPNSQASMYQPSPNYARRMSNNRLAVAQSFGIV